jgi:hypothetical protein
MADPELSAKASLAVPAVPPSTAEVSIRTLQSDLELIGRSGGMPATQFTRVPVSPDNSPAVGAAGVPLPAAREAGEPSSSGRILVWTIVILAAVALLFVAGYYLAPLFTK